MSKITLNNQNTPAQPSTGNTSVYVDPITKRLASVDDNNTTTDYGAGGGGGSGDVVGPASSLDNSIPRFHGTTGKIIQDGGGAALSDTGDLTTTGTVNGRDIATDGSAQDAHIAAANPHSGSLAVAHEGVGGAVHADVVPGGASGFMDGARATHLDGVAPGADVSPVTSVHGRSGLVVAALNDYDGSQVNNDSGVPGLTVSNALDTINGMASFMVPLYDNIALMPIDIEITESAGNIVCTLTDVAGALFVTGRWDSASHTIVTPVSVNLATGTATVPVSNYVFLTEAASVVTMGSNTTGFPADSVHLARVYIQSSTEVAAHGPLGLHIYNDDPTEHIQHIGERIRANAAQWVSGAAATLAITPGAPDDVHLSTTSGSGFQFHQHDFPAFDTATGSVVFVMNDPTTAWVTVTNLNTILTDSLGGDMSGRRFSLTVMGILNQDTGECKLAICLPSGSYNSDNAVIADADKYANFSIPPAIVSHSFLIAELKIRHQTSGGGTWTLLDTIDLRGMFPSIVAGGSSAQATEFDDVVFRINDDGDSTKQIAFEAAGIATGTIRTLSMPDADVDLHKNNEIAIVAPVVTDDSASGYAVGSRWIDITADAEYVCLDASVGAAVWTSTTAAAGDTRGALYVVGNSASGDVAADVTHLDTGNGNALRAALVASATGGGTVYVRRGSYDVGNGSPLVIPGGVTLQGEGVLTVLRLPVNGNLLSVDLGGTLRDVRLAHPFVPNGPLTTTGSDTGFVTMRGSALIIDCEFDIRADAGSVANYPGLWAAIRMTSGKNVAERVKILAYSSVSIGSGTESIGIQAISDACKVIDCTVGESTAGDKIDVAVEIGESSNISVRGCSLLRSRVMGVRLISVFGMSAMIVQNNDITPDSGSGVGLQRVGNGDVTDSLIQGNVITCAAGAGGIDLESTDALRQLDKIAIQGNVMSGSGTSTGIRLAESGTGISSNISESLNIALGFSTPRSITVTGGGLSQVGNL